MDDADYDGFEVVQDKESPDVQPIPPEWQEPDDPRPRYRLCRVAFFLGAASMALFALTGLCQVLGILGGSEELLRLIRSPLWDWLVGVPITFGSLLASYLLLGRWSEPKWRTQTMLLAAMNTIDVGYWCVEHADELGLAIRRGAPGDDGLGFVFGLVIGFLELRLFATLAAEVSTNLGHLESLGIARAARVAAGIGLALWLIVVMHQLDWRGKFPPRFLRWRDLEIFLIFLGSLTARSVSAFFVTIACAQACVHCSRELEAIAKDQKENDPFRSRSEGDL